MTTETKKPEAPSAKDESGHNNYKQRNHYNKRYSVSEVKSSAINHWKGLLKSLTPLMSETIDRGTKHGPCGSCGGDDRARCHNDFDSTGGMFCNSCGLGSDGFAVLMKVNGWTFGEALNAVAGYLGLCDRGASPTRKLDTIELKPKPDKCWLAEHDKSQATWDEATPNHLKLIEYFNFRDITCPPLDTLRLHPSLPYWLSGKSYGTFPAMLGQITLNGNLLGLHRTFLSSSHDGKAEVPKPKLSKKCSDTISGGAIQLFPYNPDKPLALCEGIETALAVHELTGYPVWSCVSATLLERVVVPECIRSIIIYADKDLSYAGQKSANVLAGRLLKESRDVQLICPPMLIPKDAKSVDWLDYLNQGVAHV